MFKRIVLLSLLCAMTSLAVQASSLVQGRIYLKDGRVIECAEKDRIELPKHSRDVKLLRSENLLPICRDRFFAVGMFHPQAQGHSLRLGIRKILYNGAQLNLLPLHAAIIKAVFTAAA